MRECISRLLDEGGATYTDGECLYENPIVEIPAYLHNRDMLFDLEMLTDDFDNAARENDLIANLQAASVFRYLYRRYGVENIKQLWERGFQKFLYIYGFRLSNLSKSGWTTSGIAG